MAEHPSFRDRLAALGEYLGWSIIAKARRRPDSDGFRSFHHSHALACIGVLGIACAGVIFEQAVAVSIYVYAARWADAFPVDLLSGCVGLLASVVVVASWLACIVRAVSGTARKIPLLSRLAQWRHLHAWFRTFGAIAFALVIAVSCVAWHSTTLVDRAPSDAGICLLYDDEGWVPRFVFDLAGYRIAATTKEPAGAPRVAVVPLDSSTLFAALQRCRAVAVLSHGDYGGIYLPGSAGLLLPEFLPYAAAGPTLEFVYLTCCRCGLRSRSWQDALHPARVRLFRRKSHMLEHVWWLWVRAPHELSPLEPM